MTRSPGLAASLLLATACASAPPPAPAPPPPPPEPTLFVEDPVDLLPDLQGVVHVNVRRLRGERTIFDKLLARALASADDEEDREQVRFLAEHVETVLFGIGRRVGDDPDFVLVVRTKGAPLVDEDGTTLGTKTEAGPMGFRRAKLGDDDLVLVDDYTALLYEAGLRTGVEAILARRPGKRFTDEPAFKGLADEVAFGSAPVSVLGTLPPELVAKITREAPPALAPLTQALTTVHSYGGQVDLGAALELRLLAQGRGSSSVGVLAGAILIMKNAVAQSGDDPLLSRMAEKLRVEARGDVLELSYSIEREELLGMLDRWLDEALKGESPEPEAKGDEI